MSLRARLASVALFCAACTSEASAHVPLDAAPPSVGVDAHALEAAEVPSFTDCARCHAEIGRSHDRSMHAAASRDPLFRREYALAPSTFCTDCHAPAEESGVDCAACHVEDGAIVSAAASGRAPHPTLARPERSTDAACAGCHQFDFHDRPGVPLQRTLDEAAERRGSEGSCTSCHMRDGDHAFSIDDDALADALRVSVEVEHVDGETIARFVLRAGVVGHAVPTGDLYRRLELRAWLAGAPSTARTRTLARVFRAGPGGLVEIADTRVPPPGRGARRVEVRLPGEGDDVRWEIALLALPRARAERSGLPSLLWQRPVRSGHARVGP